MSSSAQSSAARQVFTGIENSGALLRCADEDICPYVVRGDNLWSQFGIRPNELDMGLWPTHRDESALLRFIDSK